MIDNVSCVSRPRRALIVDDEPALRKVTAWHLNAKYGLEVHEADSASRAIQRILAEDYDLIICDQVMQNDYGTDVYRFLQRRSVSMPPFVLFTGSKYRLTEEELSMFLTVEKPNFMELLEAVDGILL
jgi:CheY-like chemotaxis protein